MSAGPLKADIHAPLFLLQRLDARFGLHGEVAIRKAREIVLVARERLDVVGVLPVLLGIDAVERAAVCASGSSPVMPASGRPRLPPVVPPDFGSGMAG
jgi:hypothetical protein